MSLKNINPYHPPLIWEISHVMSSSRVELGSWIDNEDSEVMGLAGEVEWAFIKLPLHRVFLVILIGL